MSVRFFGTILLCLLLAILLAPSDAKKRRPPQVFAVTWVFNVSSAFPDETLKIRKRDTVRFSYPAQGFHGLSYIKLTKGEDIDCPADLTSGTVVAGSAQGPATIDWKPMSTGLYNFFCPVGTHCTSKGMYLKIKVRK